MAWYLDTVRITVQKLDGDNVQIIPRLQPLSGGTVLQVFGYEDETTSLGCLVVGSGDLASLQGMVIDGLTHTLSGPENFVHDYYIKSLSHSRQMTRAQTFRSDKDCFASVFNVEMELYDGE
jgi:hypothetical protein